MGRKKRIRLRLAGLAGRHFGLGKVVLLFAAPLVDYNVSFLFLQRG